MARKKTTLRGRDAGSGRFISVASARRRKKTAIVQRIPVGRRRHKRK